MSYLTIGQPIRVQQLVEEEEQQGAYYKTRVADIEPNQICIEVPIEEVSGKVKFSPKGSEFIVTYMDQDYNNYHFKSKLLGYKEENIPLFVISAPHPDEIIKTQKRGYFRVEASLDVAIRLNQKDRNFHLITKTVNIGGGGLSFISPPEKRFEVGDALKIWLVLISRSNNITRVSFDAEVVRVQLPDENNKNTLVSVKYVNLREKVNSLIMRYCFERQLELHKKQQLLI